MNTRTFTIHIILAGMLLFTACGDDNPSGTTDDGFDEQVASSILQNEAENIILQTYTDLNTEAGLLLDAVNTLANDVSQSNLEAAQQQWVATRVPWESSESFLFGPVDTEGLDPALDSWPVNRTDLVGVLESNNDLTPEFVDGLEGVLKGFHTIEFLLFGDGNSKTANDLTSRELEYLSATTQVLKNDTQALEDGWREDAGNFVNALAQAGNGSEIFTSQRAGIEELILGMEIIADEVANGKINDPLTQQNATLVESQFSFNSKNDFQDNIRSIRHIYTGDMASNSGAGITDFVSEFNTDLDSRFKSEIEAAITAIGDIQGNFRDAITDNPESVQNAQDAVRTILQTIQENIKPLLDEF
jgi:putative iron-regulated protein